VHPQVAQAILTDLNGEDRVMANKLIPETDPGQPAIYQLRFAGHVGQHWAEWFEGLTNTLEDNGETLLTGPVVDQAALHGLLRKVRDLGILLLSVVCVSSGQAPEPHSQKEKRV
jgi:hypothetical protein